MIRARRPEIGGRGRAWRPKIGACRPRGLPPLHEAQLAVLLHVRVHRASGSQPGIYRYAPVGDNTPRVSCARSSINARVASSNVARHAARVEPVDSVRPRIVDHGRQVGAATWLIEHPERLGEVGIELLQPSKPAESSWAKQHPVERAVQRSAVEPGCLQPRTKPLRGTVRMLSTSKFAPRDISQHCRYHARSASLVDDHAGRSRNRSNSLDASPPRLGSQRGCTRFDRVQPPSPSPQRPVAAAKPTSSPLRSPRPRCGPSVATLDHPDRHLPSP